MNSKNWVRRADFATVAEKSWPVDVDPAASALLAAFPTPNYGVAGQTYSNYLSQTKASDNTTQYDLRVDWNVSSKDQSFARYSYNNEPKLIPPPLGILDGSSFGMGGNIEDEGRNFTTSETHIFGPTLTNEFRFGYNWIHAAFQQQNIGQDLSAKFGLGGIPFAPNNGGLPYFSVSGLSSFGSPQYYTSSEYENVEQALDNVTKVIGNQTIKLGGNFQRIRFQTLQPSQARGVYNFTGKYTADPNSSTNVGFGAADLALGDIQSSSLSNLSTTHDQRWYDAVFLQDDWKLTPKLTLNLGLRYEYASPVVELNGQQANFLPVYGAQSSGTYLIPRRANVTLPASLLQAFASNNINVVNTSSNSLVDPQKHTFAPRIGVAYQPSGKTVVRAGYGLFYGGLENLGYGPNLANNVPFQFSSSFPSAGCSSSACPTNGQTLETGFAAQIGDLLAEVTTPPLNAIQQDGKVPYTQSYNLSAEYQLTSSTTATIGYVGSVTKHLSVNGFGPNQYLGLVTPSENLQALIPFPAFSNGSYTVYAADANYNSFQATVKRALQNGLSFTGSYTFSHTLDDAIPNLGGTGAVGSRNPLLLGLKYDYGTSYQDVRQRFSLNTQYVLPFGKGKKYLNSGGVVDQVVGGWTGSLVFRVQTGEPVDIGAGNSPTNGIGSALGYRVGDPFKAGGTPQPGTNEVCATKVRTIQTWFKPCAFANPPKVVDSIDPSSNQPQVLLANAGTAPWGPRGRTEVVGPGYNRTDLSLFKNFSVYRETSVQFRTDVFNVLNIPSYGQPNNTIGGAGVAVNGAGNTAGFGGISSERFSGEQPDSRVIQFALKYLF